MDKKIFLGILDIASQFKYYKLGYESLGFKVYTCSPQRELDKCKYDIDYNSFRIILGQEHNFSFNSKVQFTRINLVNKLIKVVYVVLNKLLSLFWLVVKVIRWIRFIKKYDVFHFMWILEMVDKDLKWRLWLIKILKKKK